MRPKGRSPPGMRGGRLSPRIVVAGLAVAISVQAFPAFSQTLGQPPDTMAARVEACTPCHGNQGEGTSDVYFPPSSGKASRISLQPASCLQKRPAEVSADELSARISSGPLSAGHGRLLRGATARVAGDSAVRRQQSGAAAWPNSGCARRPSASNSGMRQLPWPRAHGHGAGNSGTARIASELYQRAVGSLALRHAYREGTRLHAAGRCASHRGGCHRCAAWLASRPAAINAAPAPKGAYVLPFACGSRI